MSEENVEVARRALDAFGRGELAELLTYMDPDVTLASAVIGRAEGRIYRGHEGIRSWIDDSLETFEPFRFRLSETRDLGDRVLALGQFEARGRHSGVELDSPMGWIFTLSGGRIVRLEGHLGLAEALDAAGLSE